MRYVKGNNLSVSEAEDIIARVWLVLERHGLSSPKMTISANGTKLKIEFLFESQRDANLVRAELPSGMVGTMKALELSERFNGPSAIVLLQPELYTPTVGYVTG